jgi:hypothetical protein
MLQQIYMMIILVNYLVYHSKIFPPIILTIFIDDDLLIKYINALKIKNVEMQLPLGMYSQKKLLFDDLSNFPVRSYPGYVSSRFY